MRDSALYIFSNGRVAAINKRSGEIIWETKLKEVSSAAKWGRWSVGQITEDETKLYIGVAGVLICLEKRDGKFLWENPLKGWGYGFISIAGADNSASAAAAQQRQSSAAATTAAT